MHSYFYLTFHAASTYGFFAFYLSSEPFLLNNQKNRSLADVESFVPAIHASSVPQLYQPENGSNMHAMLIVMQYTLSTGVKQKKLQHMQ